MSDLLSRNAGKALLLYSAFLAGVLLFPFHFYRPSHSEANNAKWLPRGQGIEFSPISEIRSITPNGRLNELLAPGDGLTIELWMATSDYSQKGPARIVSYSLDPFRRNFTLGQEGRDLIFRLRTEKTDLNGFPETRLRNVLLSADPYHIVVTYDYQRERIYVNGREKLLRSSVQGRFSNWDPSYPMVFGNENTGNRPWSGRLFLAALYKRPLSGEEVVQNYLAGGYGGAQGVSGGKRVEDGLIALYSFTADNGGSFIRDESGQGLDLDLAIPEKVDIDEEKRFLEVFFPSPRNVSDVMENLSAFALFGFLLHKYLRSRHQNTARTALLAIVIGIVFAVGAESIQYFLMERTSNLLDPLSRVLGVAFGLSIDLFREKRVATRKNAVRF